MAKWLDKYEQGGLVLKKKTKDNYGKRENANEGYSTAGPGWMGEGTTNKGFNYNGAWGGTMQNGGFLPQAQNGWLEKLTSTLNPYNWRVEDYSKEKDFTKAYSTAKKAGEEEFMYKGKRYNTKYAGTPRQEVGTYGVDGKPVHPMDLNHPAQVNLYPAFGKYLPGHISASVGDNETSIDYSSRGNFPFGINEVKNKGEKSFNVYGQDNLTFSNKAASLPTGDYMLEDKYTPSDWNLFINNCADNVCDAFGIPRSKGIQTPSGAVSKIKKKYPTLDVTGKTYEDYYDLSEKLQSSFPEKILPQAKNILGIASSPDLKKLKPKFISSIQQALYESGYELPKSKLKNNNNFDGVLGDETKAALLDWQKKNKSLAMGGALPGAVGFTYARTQNPAPSNGKYAKKTLASAQDGKKFRLKTLDEMAAYNISNDNIPSGKSVTNKIIKDEQAKSEIAKRKELANRETVRSYDPETENESTLSRAWNIISHPMTALSYKTRGKDIPEHFERGEHNILENVTNILNPFFYANEVKGAAGDLSTYYDDVKSRGLYRANPNVLGSSALHTLNALPLLSEAAPFISKAASSIPTSSRYISKLENLGQVQTSGINKRAVQMMMGREPGASNVLGREAQAVNNEAQTLGTQTRSQRLASYEPPTDAEIAAMNEAEANRYFRRPEQEARRPVGISQAEIEEYLARDPQARSAAQAATNDLRTEASSNVNMDAIVHSNNPMITERRLAGRQTALRTSGFTDAEIAADEAALRRGDPIRTPAQIRGGGISTYEQYRSRSEAPMKEWNAKEFRIGEGNETGITKM